MSGLSSSTALLTEFLSVMSISLWLGQKAPLKTFFKELPKAPLLPVISAFLSRRLGMVFIKLTVAYLLVKIFTILFEAFPSHSSGIFLLVFISLFITFNAFLMILSLFVLTKRFVPC